MGDVHVEGLQEVQGKLNAAMGKLFRSSYVGMAALGEFVLSEARRRTPVDTGNLMGSSGMDIRSGPQGHTVIVFYEASYAIFVHEVPATHEAAPVKDWQFLSRAISENYDKLLPLVADKVKPT